MTWWNALNSVQTILENMEVNLMHKEVVEGRIAMISEILGIFLIVL